MITTTNGRYRKATKGRCECVIGQDEKSKQPHLIKCGKPVEYLWFWRNWFGEIIKGSTEPIYSNVGAPCCGECFDKVKDAGPPKDLEKYRKIWEEKKSK